MHVFNASFIPTIFFFFPETNGKVLEDIDELFESSGTFSVVSNARRMGGPGAQEMESRLNTEDGESAAKVEYTTRNETHEAFEHSMALHYRFSLSVLTSLRKQSRGSLAHSGKRLDDTSKSLWTAIVTREPLGGMVSNVWMIL